MYVVSGATSLIRFCTPEHLPLITEAPSYACDTINVGSNPLFFNVSKMYVDRLNALRELLVHKLENAHVVQQSPH